jgi:hypothetical protein
MTVDELKQYLRDTFAGIRMDEAQGDTFVTYDPDGDLSADRWLPFVTIVTADTYETVSDLNHPDTYRLNIGLTKKTYTDLFGPAPTERDADGILATGHDHAARDHLMPHPVYASQHWVCVINPSSLDPVRRLLAEAYDFAVRKHGNTRARRSGA